MRTPHKDYTIITSVTLASRGKGWVVMLEIVNDQGDRVVAAHNLSADLVFTTETQAHRAGILLARHWIDGDGAA